ncbi:hypothetical protein, partial [Xanthomonas campestris]|uniref:hypothetical protein n=1 Tax=Xanthomonas campestris TaxID=339 RepID=UPI0040392606
LPAGLLALAQALSVTERQLHGSLLNIRRVVSRICGALFRGSLVWIELVMAYPNQVRTVVACD